MIDAILPPAAVAVEVRDDPVDRPPFPAEEALLAQASAKRRREFTTGRHCAHRALEQLGAPPGAILPGPRGEPCWPDGVVGSITHCHGYRAAAVAWEVDVETIGIDAEPNEPLPDGILDAISLPGERAAIDEHTRAAHEVCWDRLLFSAKEAVYKAWYPTAARMLGFDEAELTIDTSGRLQARLLVPGPRFGNGDLVGFFGRWLATHDLVVTAITSVFTRPSR